MEPQPTTDPSTIAADNYLDDRSTGVDVLSSLFNAINSHEYVRAYSYWQPNAQGLAPFDQFQQGYADTQSVEVTFGTPIPDLGAGQTRSHVPVLLVARTAQGGSQTYVGCYTTHLGLPSAQAIPPFQPTAIESASVRRVPPGANTDKLLQDVCSQYQ
jgi:hypothetical protein